MDATPSISGSTASQNVTPPHSPHRCFPPQRSPRPSTFNAGSGPRRNIVPPITIVLPSKNSCLCLAVLKECITDIMLKQSEVTRKIREEQGH
ncbi:hypothetical protein NPIL_89591 [Nephila pilipes]|uniref:Uncharacterized protein n=1 Tax=Nephila pilipes TaxID=299642 RepID=A0A8X6N1I0_NEPPI|nr:hypothetical protein NPIL_89591 [Nephila pilipes]